MKSFKQIRDERMHQFGCCELCGRKFSLELHHIIPKSMGGTDEEDNLILICGVCHSRLTPKRELVKHGLKKHAIEYYLRTYLYQKFHMHYYEIGEECGWSNFGVDIGYEAFQRLYQKELDRLERFGKEGFFKWKNMDKEQERYWQTAEKGELTFTDMNGTVTDMNGKEIANA